jgi:hypothetical protein
MSSAVQTRSVSPTAIAGVTFRFPSLSAMCGRQKLTHMRSSQIASSSTPALSLSWSGALPPPAPSGGPPAHWASAPVEFSILQCTLRLLCPGLQLNPVSYKGFAITARTFQIRASGRWTLDLLIGRHRSLRAFSGPRTYPTEESAITGCCEFGQRIIDGRVRDCSVDDLS